MPVSADPAVAEAMAKMESKHVDALADVHVAMQEVSAVDHTAFSSRPVDKLGNPLGPASTPADTSVDIEAVLERAHQRRVEQGRAQSSETMVQQMRAPASLVTTLQSELDAMCVKLGEARANYMLAERQLLAAIETKATQLAMAKEMSK